MKLVNRISIAVFFVFMVSVHSCKDYNTGKITEGVIKYKITYLKDKAENPLISLLPSYTKMYFKDDFVKFNITGWMGVFESRFIKDAKNKEVVVALKMMNKKIFYKSNEMSDFMGMSNYNDLKIDFDDKTKKILDYDCKHAVVSNVKNNTSFDLYYTDKIGVENPNLNTIYEPIKGVLMELQIEVNGIPMLLVADEVKKEDIPQSYFSVPKGYLSVKKHHIDSIFSSIM